MNTLEPMTFYGNLPICRSTVIHDVLRLSNYMMLNGNLQRSKVFYDVLR